MSATPSVLPVIMAGGSGTRLWPLSRSLFPKQYQQLHPAGGSLFGAALKLAGGLTQGRLEVVTNFEHRFMVQQQMRELDPGLLDRGRIWTEPAGRNTCAVAALAAQLAEVPEQVVLLLAADHYIADSEAAMQALRQGCEIAAEGDRLVVFGVKPTEPTSEYGYIEVGEQCRSFRSVKSFVEKPDAETARTYCASGNYLWNSGIFAVRQDLLAREILHRQPVLWRAVDKACKARQKPAEYEQLPEGLWATVPQESFDRAIVQRAEGPIAVVDFDVGWSDMGSYNSLREAGQQDAAGNVSVGRVVAEQSSGNYLHAAPDRTLAALGLENMVVVDTADALLVTPLSQTKNLRELVARMEQQSSEVLHRHRQDYRPWGHFRVLQPESENASGQRFQCKLLSVRPGASLSRQSHEHRSEHWVVVRGVATVEIDAETRMLRTGESTFIPRRAVHRLSNESDEELQVVEVQIGDDLSEDDIKRYSDDYGRAGKRESGV